MNLSKNWKDTFTDREKLLIENCITYTENDPAGLPGHNLMLIIYRMSKLLDQIGDNFIFDLTTSDDSKP